MLNPRVIPCLLLKDTGLVKTIKFKKPIYIGDPLNAVKIFNEKEVDELVFLDIIATTKNRKPFFELISKIATECFMPFAYGGGIREIEDVKQIFHLGAEKIIINSYAVENPAFISTVSQLFGRQSIIISIDAKKDLLGRYRIFTHGGRRGTNLDPAQFAIKMEKMGAGEILLTSIEKDGTMQGYDLKLIKKVAQAVSIPVIACGGAAKLTDFSAAVKEANAAAVAAGAMFVFQGENRAVLINYPYRKELEKIFN